MDAPRFYPGLSLKAKHLADFEEYLLSRQNLISLDFGIIESKPPAFTNNILQVYNAAGITPSGTPVLITEEHPLLLEFNLSHDSIMIDLYIENNHNSSHNETEYSKYKLSYLPVLRRENLPINKEDSLYLGRYTLSYDNCNRVEPPYFYNLNAAYHFLGKDKWSDWTKNIRKKLRELMDRHPGNQLINYNISEIIFNYSNWPISKLFKKCTELAVSCQRPDLNDLLEETFMTEMLSSQTEIETFSYLPEHLPLKIIDCLKGIDINPDWRLMDPRQYEFKDNKITIKQTLNGNNEIKIQFKELVPTDYLHIKGIPHVSKPHEEKNEWGTPCWSYIVKYVKASTNPLTAPWDIKLNNLKGEFSILYRAIPSELGK